MNHDTVLVRIPGPLMVSLLATALSGGCKPESVHQPSDAERSQGSSSTRTQGEHVVENPDYTTRAIGKTLESKREGDEMWLEWTWGVGPVGRQASLPINHPPVVATSQATHMLDEDHVVGVIFDGEARAYPWWILSSGHVVNDMIGGRPVVVSMCERCSGISAFIAELDGMPLDFRLGGIHKGTWFARDYQTGSFWHPFIGSAWRGSLTGERLEPLGTYQSRWVDWKRDHPNSTVVLGSSEQRNRAHARHDNALPKFPGRKDKLDIRSLRPTERNARRNLLEASAMVYGLVGREGSAGKAYPLELLRSVGGVIQDKQAGRPVVVMLQGEFQVGAFERQFNGQDLVLKLVSEEPLVVEDQNTNRWDLWGRAKAGPSKGHQLTLTQGYLTEWYEWLYNFQETEIYDGGSSESLVPLRPSMNG